MSNENQTNGAQKRPIEIPNGAQSSSQLFVKDNEATIFLFFNFNKDNK